MSAFGIAEGETSDALPMPDELFTDLIFAHAPDASFRIGRDSDEELIIAGEVAVPYPSTVATEHGLFFVFFSEYHLFAGAAIFIQLVGFNLFELEHFTGAIGRARRQVLVICAELALEDVVLRVRFNDLHGHVLALLLLPNKTVPLRVARH